MITAIDMDKVLKEADIKSAKDFSIALDLTDEQADKVSMRAKEVVLRAVTGRIADEASLIVELLKAYDLPLTRRNLSAMKALNATMKIIKDPAAAMLAALGVPRE